MNFRSKVLRRLFEDGDTRGIQPPKVAARVLAILDSLHSSKSLAELSLSGLHQLSGDRSDTWAATVTRNWRLTFVPVIEKHIDSLTGETEEQFQIQNVDYEDYH